MTIKCDRNDAMKTLMPKALHTVTVLVAAAAILANSAAIAATTTGEGYYCPDSRSEPVFVCDPLQQCWYECRSAENGQPTGTPGRAPVDPGNPGNHGNPGNVGNPGNAKNVGKAGEKGMDNEPDRSGTRGRSGEKGGKK